MNTQFFSSETWSLSSFALPLLTKSAGLLARVDARLGRVHMDIMALPHLCLVGGVWGIKTVLLRFVHALDRI